MTLFNSLGSNYTLKTVLTALVEKDSDYQVMLTSFLENKYGGQVDLVYKGRHAIRLALRYINNRKYTVGICGFTCYAVYEAVEEEGYQHVYLDIDHTLNFTYEAVVSAVKKHPDLKILIIQNTLGYPMDFERVNTFCRKNGIIIIEDLAHCVGAIYENGMECGTSGDFTVLSFSQDKMIDGISGGALVTRSTNFSSKTSLPSLVQIGQNRELKDRLYPANTYFIRKTYGLGLGKLYHYLLKKIHGLPLPVGERGTDIISRLPGWYCGLILLSFDELGKSLQHRRSIANIYASILDKKIMSEKNCAKIEQASCLRFPVFVKDPKKIIAIFKKQGIFISDTWYDAPIAPARYLTKTDYTNQCPKSEEIARTIINLPTHVNIDEEAARNIASLLNSAI